MVAPFQNHLEHLDEELTWLDAVLRDAIARARSGRDPWGGLCISDAIVDKLTESPVVRRGEAGEQTATPDRDELGTIVETRKAAIVERVRVSLERGVQLRLPRLARLFGLSPFEQDVLLLCLAPELDLKYERLYAYLHDDATRRVLSIELVLRVLCRTVDERSTARESFLSGNRLRRYCLMELVVADPGVPLLGRTLRLDARIVEYLLGGSRIDGWLGSSIRIIQPPQEPADATHEQTAPLLPALDRYLKSVQSEPWLAVLHGADRLERERTARELCAAVGIPLVVTDLEALAQLDLPFETTVRNVFREAALQSAAVYFDEGDVLHADADKTRVRVRQFETALLDMGWITFVSGRAVWEPPDALKRRWLFFAEFPVPPYNERRRLWEDALDGQAAGDVDAGALAARFRFTTAGLLNAMSGARNQARLRGDGVGPLSHADLQNACRTESSHGLQRYARRITTSYTWDDLVLPSESKRQLHEIVAFVRHREVITAEWGFGAKHVLGKGTNILFTGPSGTGKTMAVGIIASELGLDLYKVDLSAVVSKYIGETEKNLNRVFNEAETANAVLFFDEADALFGRRSEVKDSHDRYANIEVNYLLQKMEEHEGIVVLATNMSKNMDEAFVRRLQFTVVFPFPEEAERLRIWQQVFPSQAPLDDDVRFEFLARRMKIAGGNIKNIALGAALLARADGGSIGMRHLVLSAKREFQKMGKICARADFGEYYELVG